MHMKTSKMTRGLIGIRLIYLKITNLYQSLNPAMSTCFFALRCAIIWSNEFIPML